MSGFTASYDIQPRNNLAYY